MNGTISRWGSKGYGFVYSDELSTEAWLHAKFLDDPEYQPRQGDKVEFEPERLPDGRFQARRVRLVGSPHRARLSDGPPRPAWAGQGGPAGGPVYNDVSGSNGGGFSVKLSLGSVVLPPQRSAENGDRTERMASERARDKAVERVSVVEAPQPGLRAEPAGIEKPAAPTTPIAVVTGEPNEPAPPVEEPRLALRLSSERRLRDAALGELEQALGQVTEALLALRAKEEDLTVEIARRRAGGAAADGVLVSKYIEVAAGALEGGLDEKRRLAEAAEQARRHAIQRSGLPPVEEYEEVRARLREATGKKDGLAEKAFRSFERERRGGLRELADALDRLESAPSVEARFIAFVGPRATALVAPIRAPLPTGTGSHERLSVRMALAFWHAAERAARELSGEDAVVEHGRVHGSLAVRLGPFDAGLLPLLLDETWSSRPLLDDLGIERHFEMVEGVEDDWQPEELDANAEVAGELAAAGGAPSGGALPEIATRLGLGLHDLVATLHDRGLPFPDDMIDAGTEQTLRALFGENHGEGQRHNGEPAMSGAARSLGAPPVIDSDEPAGEDDEDARSEGPLSTASVASRMLKKLLRDRRVGGRHTRIENAYGHHFSDGEKLQARRVAEWLEKEGIFMPKLNEGSHHISINPRRLREVGQIIDGTWERREQLDEI